MLSRICLLQFLARRERPLEPRAQTAVAPDATGCYGRPPQKPPGAAVSPAARFFLAASPRCVHAGARFGALLCGIVLCASAAAQAAEFPLYPGAVYDAALSHKSIDQVARSGLGSAVLHSAAYLTPDPFEAVLGFYRKVAREYAMPGRAADHRLVLPAEIGRSAEGFTETPSQVVVQEAFFILDGAGDLAHSSHWLMIARPIIGHMSIERQPQHGLRFHYRDLREATVITYVETRR
jgi:hypothetical protein